MTLNAEQTANEQQIIAAAKSLGLGTDAEVIATMTALDESGLHVYTSADEPAQEGSSRGLFQQLKGWGTEQARENPFQSAIMFFKGGAEGQPGLLNTDWQHAPTPWQAAENVQQSATPGGTNYQQYFDEATQIVQQLGGGTYTPSPMSASNASFSNPFGGGNPLDNPGGSSSGPGGKPWLQWLTEVPGTTLQNPAGNGPAGGAVTGTIKAAQDTAALISGSVNLLGDLMNPSHWLRWIAGFGGILILGIAIYLVATSTDEGTASE